MRKLSRRGVFTATAAAAVVAAASAPLEAQSPTTPQASNPPVPTSSREEDLASARAAIQNSSAALAKVKIPIATEPAFVFKAF